MKNHPLSMDILRGCHHIEQRGEGQFLQRCPQSVCELYKEDHNRMIRLQSPAGIRIVFKTDSTSVKLHFSYGRASREIYAFSVFCDGKTVEPVMEHCLLSLDLDGKMHTLEILVPHLVECYFRGIDLDDDAVLETVPAPEKRLLFVGDSIMQGMTTSQPAFTYADKFARAAGADFFNASIAGITAEPEWAKLIADEYDYDTVLICLGINDYARGKRLADYTRDLTDFVAAFRNKKMVLISMLHALNQKDENAAGEPLQAFRDAVRTLAKSRPDTTFVDGLTLAPAEEQYFIDQLHPNDLGAETVFENLKKALL